MHNEFTFSVVTILLDAFDRDAVGLVSS